MKKSAIQIFIMAFVLCAFYTADGDAQGAVTNIGTGYAQTSLSAAAATGAGTTLTTVRDSFGNFPRVWTWTHITAGSPTGVTVNLEGSIDGTNWFTLDSSTATTSEMRHVVYKPVLYIRCNLATLSGGSSPTDTCTIAAF